MMFFYKTINKMISKNRIIIASFVFIFILSGIINLFLLEKVISFQKIISLEKFNILKDSIAIESIQNLILTYVNVSDIKLDKDILVSDSESHFIKLQKLITDKKLIYHFDENNCMVCVEEYLPYLKDLSLKFGKDNVLIIGSFDNSRNLFLTLKKYDLQMPIYNIDRSFLKGKKISILNAPFIFELDSLLTINKLFIPEKGLPDLSKKFSENLNW